MTMMAKTTNEYAKALMELALEKNALDEFYSSLKEIQGYFLTYPEYPLMLSSPALTLKERVGCVDAAFGENHPECVVSFLKILCEEGNVCDFVDCVNDFEDMKLSIENTAVAKVYSSFEIADNQKDLLVKALEKRYGKNVLAQFVIDKALIGGIKVEIDGETLDGSIKKNLTLVKDVIGK